MTENVKIKIKEYDKTSPAGNGIDSTDIAFIPGFSVLDSAPKNIPTLVTSTREFEKLFGTVPYILTHTDISEEYATYGFVAGECDKSYVYAKELLYQGMPVVYSNVVSTPTTTNHLIQIAKDSSDKFEITDLDNKPLSGFSYAYDKTLPDTEGNTSELTNVLCITPSANISKEVTLKIRLSDFPVEGIKKNVPTMKALNIMCESDNDKVVVKDVYLNTSDIKYTNSVFTQYTNRQLEFINSTTRDDIVENVYVVVTLTINLKETETVKLTLLNRTSSLLDAFYGPNAVINNQWAISSATDPVDNTIADKSIYSVKYITSGGYPSVVNDIVYKKDEKGEVTDKVDSYIAKSVFATDMLKAAEHRGDAVALIDYQYDPDEKRVFNIDSDDTTKEKGTSFYAKMQAAFDGKDDNGYATAMYPWATYNCDSTLGAVEDVASPIISMPASFGYLMCLAKAIKSSPNWLAMAGVTRGLVPGIDKLLVPGNAISNAVAEEMQPKFGVDNHNISINTITNIRPYGLTLWGNRTLKPVSNEGTVALNFLNTRNMLSDIKKLLYTTAKSCMFEQNSTDLWIKFKGGIEPLLRRLKAGNGISDYQIVRGATKYNGDPLTKGEIAAVIKVYPMYAVEYFELSVEINDEEVTVS